MIMGMIIYSSLHSIFSNQISGFPILLLVKIPFINTKVKHYVFFNLNKIVNYLLSLEVVAIADVNILPKSVNKFTSTPQWIMKGNDHMHQIKHIYIIQK